MKDRLKEITDDTISELLCNEIILPSNYFQCFDKHAKNVDIELDHEEFEKELNELIVDEFNSINSYINDAVRTIDNAADITKEVQKAIQENDSSLLKTLYNQITTLKKELENITDNIYKDYLTNVYNKKWLYQKYLNEKTAFKEDAIIVLIDVKDYNYISRTYNKLIANNLLIYISNYLDKKLTEEQLDFEIVRYMTNKFVILFNESDENQIKSIINLTSNTLFETTLKSNSGILIKPTFEYISTKVTKNSSFHNTLEALIKELNDKN